MCVGGGGGGGGERKRAINPYACCSLNCEMSGSLQFKDYLTAGKILALLRSEILPLLRRLCYSTQSYLFFRTRDDKTLRLS